MTARDRERATRAQWALEELRAAPKTAREALVRLVARAGVVAAGEAVRGVRDALEHAADAGTIARNAKAREVLLRDLDAILGRVPAVLGGGAADGRLVWWAAEGVPLVRRAARVVRPFAARRRAGRPSTGHAEHVARLRAVGATKREAEAIVAAIQEPLTA